MRNTSIEVYDEDDDYDMVKGWWQAHGWPGVSPHILPQFGAIASFRGRPAAAGWLYMDNSRGVSMLEWVVTNPDNTPRASLAAIGALVTYIKDYALSQDYGVMLTSCKQDSLLKLFERNGFEHTDSGVHHAVAILR